ALHNLGYYPGTEAALNVCPISGLMNVCMADAVKAFQASKGIEQTGTLGPATRVALNSAYGISTPLAAVPESVPAPSVASAALCAPLSRTLAPSVTDATTAGEVSRLQTLLAKDAA